MHVARFSGLVVSLLLPALFSVPPLPAQTPPVHFKEGASRGFLTVRDGAGHVIAAGDLTETVHGRQVESRLTFHFRDGSLDDDTTVFSQDTHFRLIRDRHIQRGPSFPGGQDLLIDVPAQQVTSRDANPAGPSPAPAHVEHVEHVDLPPDICNGIVLLLVRNLGHADPEIKVPYLAFSGKPRLVHLAISPEGPAHFHVAGHPYPADRFLIKVELGGLTGVVAPIIGKQPTDSHVWVATGRTPAIVRLDAALYFGGPIWSIQLATPVW